MASQKTWLFVMFLWFPDLGAVLALDYGPINRRLKRLSLRIPAMRCGGNHQPPVFSLTFCSD